MKKLINIIVDTREKAPHAWTFSRFRNVKTTSQKLDTGDYSIVGFEDTLCVERKKSVSEIAQNVTQERFDRVLERMSEIPHSYLLFEFSQEDVAIFPKGSKLPWKVRRRIRTRGPFILKRLNEIQELYPDLQIIYGENKKGAERIAINIIREIYNLYE